MLKVILPCQFLDPQSPRYLRPPLHCLQTLCGCRGASIWQANSSITNIINHPNSPVKMQLYWSNLLTNSNLRQLCRHLLLNSSRSLGVTAELWYPLLPPDPPIMRSQNYDDDATISNISIAFTFQHDRIQWSQMQNLKLSWWWYPLLSQTTRFQGWRCDH